MNLTKIFPIAFLLLALGIGSNAQERPQPVLVDEFGAITCEDLSARLDYFFVELSNDPTSTGYIVMSADAKANPRLLWRELYIDGYPRYRRFDEDRLLVVHGVLNDGVEIQMWKVPLGGELPATTLSERPYELWPSRSKLRLYSDFGEVGPCYTSPPFRLLSKYLLANPELVANIAIGTPTSKSFRAAKQEISARFRDVYKVEPSRLRFFSVRTKYDPEIYEVWLLRRKSK